MPRQEHDTQSIAQSRAIYAPPALQGVSALGEHKLGVAVETRHSVDGVSQGVAKEFPRIRAGLALIEMGVDLSAWWVRKWKGEKVEG